MDNPLAALKRAGSLRSWMTVVPLVLLSACGTTGEGSGVTAHGISTEIKGTQDIQGIQVLYGKEVITFKGVYRTGGGSGWNAPMPIPDKMTVRWTANGESREVVIPLIGKVSQTFPLKRWRLYFYGENLELWREEQTGPISSTGLQPRQAVKVYP